jgi:uncharacterized protein YbjT (DUF2867 family)
MTALTLVLSGTGKTGRRVVQRLTALDVPVRIGCRSGGLPFDWEDPATWAPALTGVKAAYVSYYPDLAAPGAAEAIGSFAETAVNSGARRLVMLSGRGGDEAVACEKALAEAGADWTVLRCSWFDQNFSEGYLLEPVLSGHVVLPAPAVGEPFVDADDIADVAAAVLTQADAVAEIAAATGRRIGYAAVPAADYAEAMAAEGVPAEIIELLTYLFTTVLDGRNAHLGNGIQQVLGRPASDFAGYARDAAATGIWNQG